MRQLTPRGPRLTHHHRTQLPEPSRGPAPMKLSGQSRRGGGAVDPAPEMGSSLFPTERLEGSDQASIGVKRAPSGAEDAAMAVPSTSRDPGQAPRVSAPAPVVTGAPEIAPAAATEPNAAPTGADASLAAISVESAAGPWTEPNLPGLPAGAPPAGGRGAPRPGGESAA